MPESRRARRGKHGTSDAVSGRDPGVGTARRTVEQRSARFVTAADVGSGRQLLVFQLRLSIFAAMMKSLSVRPSILWVHSVISALPQANRISG